MRSWDELIAEFRALGGVADNVRLGEGAFGRGLFTVDPSLPVRIHVPESLLLETRHVVFEDGRLQLSPEAPASARERRFFEDYHAALSWSGGGRAEVARVFEEAHALPAELREQLAKVYRCGSWFEAFDETAIQKRFVASRCIRHGGRPVMMPVLDLANHGQGLLFVPGDGLNIQGLTAGEVLVSYSELDAYGMFMQWGFVAPQRQAFSIALNGNIGQQPLHIDRDFAPIKSMDQFPVPTLAIEDGTAKLKFLVAGNRGTPRLVRGAFYKVMREAGLSGYEEAFDMIQYVNQMHFLNLLDAIEDFDGPIVEALRRMARFQLQAMSFSFGVRVG